MHMHHGMLQLTNFPRKIIYVVSADYDVSPSCRFSNGAAYIILLTVLNYTKIVLVK